MDLTVCGTSCGSLLVTYRFVIVWWVAEFGPIPNKVPSSHLSCAHTGRRVPEAQVRRHRVLAVNIKGVSVHWHGSMFLLLPVFLDRPVCHMMFGCSEVGGCVMCDGRRSGVRMPRLSHATLFLQYLRPYPHLSPDCAQQVFGFSRGGVIDPLLATSVCAWVGGH